MVSVRPLHPDAVRAFGGRYAAVRTQARTADLDRLVSLILAGELRVPVEHVVPLDELAQAHHRAETDGLGKVVVGLRPPASR